MVARFGGLFYPRLLEARPVRPGDAKGHYAAILERELCGAQNEQLATAYISASGRLVAAELIASGSAGSVVTEARGLFASALVLDARQLVLAHNHPSGSPFPSEEDRRATAMVRQMAGLLGIELVDHLIFAGAKTYSMRKGELL